LVGGATSAVEAVGLRTQTADGHRRRSLPPWERERGRRSFQRIAFCAYVGSSKTKQNLIKKRKSPWISLDSFGGIGIFQRVTANPNKKFKPVSEFTRYSSNAYNISMPHYHPRRPRLIQPMGKGLSDILIIVKGLL
jgi:hypothetical protein